MRGPGVKKTAFSVLVALWMASATSFAWAQSNTLAYAEPAIEVDDQLRQKLLDNIRAADSFEDRFDAEAWLMLMSGRLERYVRDPDRRLRLLRKIHSAARQTDLQPELVLAVIEVESHFNHYAVSPVGAQGIMQVMPFWKNEIGRPEDNLINLETNLRYGCTILKHYLERSEGRLAEALARYNGSYGSYRYAAKVMDAWERWR
ncbi:MULTISPECIES: lytic transglycosylase domain-containing protein [unclassified Marinimicrobium]|jgi:soluble lytic murein transglycosylase-like protein|uniref:lytic transglycosylase domain-containing protein n=1 Tax=unclassified Marinimicrobium TaxID=2632100 RepID=UPI00257BE375|nr:MULTISPECIES: lytic transglycosylase domain-containing protein [unclassified Marinimicrobium]|tara:strand:+ start:227 stop:835 length:609 start_codon:yes stop_codon:yes gene_type:complete